MIENQNNLSNSKVEEISFKELLENFRKWINFLFQKWILIATFGILGGLVGVVYAYMQKPKYVAVLTYALDDEKNSGGMSGALGLASTLGFDLGNNSAGGAFGSSNLIELMHSRALIEKTLLSTVENNSKNETLAEFYLDIKKTRKSWEGKKELEKIKFDNLETRDQFSRAKDSILGRIYDDIDKNQLSIYQKDKKVSIITIEVKCENELFAKEFCQSLVKVVSDFYIETKIKKGKLNLSILQTQVDSVRSELNSAITGVAISTDNTFNLNPALNVRRTPTSKRQVDLQANSAILSQLVANLEMAKVNLRKETPLIQIIDVPILPLKVEATSKSKSLILGLIISTILISIFFISKQVINDLLSDKK